MERRDEPQGRVLTTRSACQVVPDISTFSVDDGFSYLIPDDLTVRIGSRVRVRVSGRRVKGFVTALFEADPRRKLLPVEGLSGDIASFDPLMLESLRWASTHYVTPLSVILKRTIPPNVPKRAAASTDENVVDEPDPDEGDRSVYRIGSPPYDEAIASTIRPFAGTHRTVVVIAPSVMEINGIAEALKDEYGERVIKATSSMSGAEVTRAWSRIATGAGLILVGTREIVFWPFGNVGLVVVVEDGRRVMRSPGTPTLSVREVILRRANIESFHVEFHGPVPTLEAIVHGTRVESKPGRQWPVVEVVDRSEEPPGGGLLTERAKAAIRRTTADGERSFVLVGSRGYAPAFRCVACGDIRRCPTCESAASRDDTCRRCGTSLGVCTNCDGARFQPLGAGVGRIVDDIGRLVGDDVGRVDDGRLVTVGSERDLIGIGDVGLAVAVDVDGLTMAPHYRAAEDALRLLVRLAQTVRRGAGHRCLVQTSAVNQDVVKTLANGRSAAFLESELMSRGKFGFPPIGSLIAIETEGIHDAGTLLVEGLSGTATVLGPAPARDRLRWLIQGRDLEQARLALRPILTTLRGRGAKVRVDVDPIDL
ncbi:MAG: hypothetical protein ACC683_00690, partial [Acidimicrobiia bacterium]